MLPLRRSALHICFLAQHSEALEGPFFAVPLTCVPAREVISTILTKVYGERVHLRAITVPLEFVLLVELGIGTEMHLISRTDPCSLSACVTITSAWYPVLRSFGMSKPVRSLYLPPLLETRLHQGSMLNSLRIWDREHLCSASCFLGSTI